MEDLEISIAVTTRKACIQYSGKIGKINHCINLESQHFLCSVSVIWSEEEKIIKAQIYGVCFFNYFCIFYYEIIHLILFMLFSVCVAESVIVNCWCFIHWDSSHSPSLEFLHEALSQHNLFKKELERMWKM